MLLKGFFGLVVCRGKGSEAGLGYFPVCFPLFAVISKCQTPAARNHLERDKVRSACELCAVLYQSLMDGLVSVQNHDVAAAQSYLVHVAVFFGQLGKGDVRHLAQLHGVAHHGPGEGSRQSSFVPKISDPQTGFQTEEEKEAGHQSGLDLSTPFPGDAAALHTKLRVQCHGYKISARTKKLSLKYYSNIKWGGKKSKKQYNFKPHLN